MLYYLPLKKVGEDYMERYAEVKSRKELKEQFDGAKQIGTGFEGKAYLTKDNKVLKIISTKAPLIPEEQADCIIMKQDAESKSVFFPDKLFIINATTADTPVVLPIPEYIKPVKVVKLASVRLSPPNIPIA